VLTLREVGSSLEGLSIDMRVIKDRGGKEKVLDDLRDVFCMELADVTGQSVCCSSEEG
jgi:hypothetical protein